MSERHFRSEEAIREFVADVAPQHREDAEEWDTYEAASALYKEEGLCPWSITTHFESNVPYGELSGPSPRTMIEHEAMLCLEALLEDYYTSEE
jgi:hypothetical protein